MNFIIMEKFKWPVWGTHEYATLISIASYRVQPDNTVSEQFDIEMLPCTWVSVSIRFSAHSRLVFRDATSDCSELTCARREAMTAESSDRTGPDGGCAFTACRSLLAFCSSCLGYTAPYKQAGVFVQRKARKYKLTVGVVIHAH